MSSDTEFQCQWRGCGRTKKAVAPFPNLQRLARHVKEVHILKANGRVIPPNERSKLVNLLTIFFIMMIVYFNFSRMLIFCIYFSFRNYMPSKGTNALPLMETGKQSLVTFLF